MSVNPVAHTVGQPDRCVTSTRRGQLGRRNRLAGLLDAKVVSLPQGIIKR